MGHAKNFSIQLLPQQQFRLTPLYDVVSAYPAIGPGSNQWADQELKLAMALLGKNRHYLMHGIARRHFNSTARKVGFGEDAEAVIEELLRRTPGAIAQVQARMPAGFSQKVASSVLAGLQRAAEALARASAAKA